MRQWAQVAASVPYWPWQGKPGLSRGQVWAMASTLCSEAVWPPTRLPDPPVPGQLFARAPPPARTSTLEAPAQEVTRPFTGRPSLAAESSGPSNQPAAAQLGAPRAGICSPPPQPSPPTSHQVLQTPVCPQPGPYPACPGELPRRLAHSQEDRVGGRQQQAPPLRPVCQVGLGWGLGKSGLDRSG